MSRIIFILIFLLTGCASRSVHHSARNLSLNDLKDITVGKTTESELVVILGEPYSRNQRNGYYTLNYDTFDAKAQRVSATFSEQGVLIGYLWIPSHEDQEIDLEKAKRLFNGVKFKISETTVPTSHNSTKIVVYSDDSAGISIRYNKNNNVVEAIAFHNRGDRLPTGKKEF